MDLGVHRAGASMLGVVLAQSRGLLDEFEGLLDEFEGLLDEFEVFFASLGTRHLKNCAFQIKSFLSQFKVMLKSV